MITHYRIDCPAALCKLLLVFSICLMTASGQGIDPVCHNIRIGEYANMSFCLPPEVSVNTGAVEEGNYSEGGDVISSLMLNGGNVSLHLIYPCSINADLGPSEIRSFLNAFDPQTEQALYSSTPLDISGRIAVWGELRNRTFAAYQPSNGTIAVIIFDEDLPYAVISSFLNSLQISIDESGLRQMYCQPPAALPGQTSEDQNPSNITSNVTANETVMDIAMNRSSDVQVQAKPHLNITANETAMDIAMDKEFGPDAEALLAGREVSQEALMAEQQMARQRIEASAGNVQEKAETQNPFPSF